MLYYFGVKKYNFIQLRHKVAFENLSLSSKDLLNFIDESVMEDYKLLVDTGVKYEEDAKFVSCMSEDIAAMSQQINATIGSVVSIVQNISQGAQASAANSRETLVSIVEITRAMKEITNNAQEQAEGAEQLNWLVSKFKI